MMEVLHRDSSIKEIVRREINFQITMSNMKKDDPTRRPFLRIRTNLNPLSNLWIGNQQTLLVIIRACQVSANLNSTMVLL